MEHSSTMQTTQITLHHLAQFFSIHLKNVEEIRAPCHPPEWIPITDIHIDGRKEDTVKCAEEANKEVQIFTTWDTVVE